MRLAHLAQGKRTLGTTDPINPRTSLVGLTARLTGDTGATAVSSTFSVLGSVNTFAPEPILFGGASIISLSGTGSAQWSDRIDACVYTDIKIDLLSLSTLTSFQASATEADV